MTTLIIEIEIEIAIEIELPGSIGCTILLVCNTCCHVI